MSQRAGDTCAWRRHESEVEEAYVKVMRAGCVQDACRLAAKMTSRRQVKRAHGAPSERCRGMAYGGPAETEPERTPDGHQNRASRSIWRCFHAHTFDRSTMLCEAGDGSTRRATATSLPADSKPFELGMSSTEADFFSRTGGDGGASARGLGLRPKQVQHSPARPSFIVGPYPGDYN